MDALTAKRLARYETEFRAKYTAEEIEALGGKGEAFKDADGSYSYPIADAEDLDNAIRAVGRGNADHDAIRKYIAARAKALGKDDAVPDNWNSDGSLSDDKSASMTVEQRQTYRDTYDLLSSAIAEKFQTDNEDSWVWLEDFTDEWVVFCQDSQKMQATYTLDGTTVTLGDAVPVTETTTYTPMETKSAPANPATPKRAFSTLIEQPPPHVVDIQVRMAEGDSPRTALFIGIASTTGEAYSVRDWLGEYMETMLAGCYGKTLREQTAIPLLLNHDGLPMANTSSNTSRLAEGSGGLRNEADLDLRQMLTNDVVIALERGDINKMSISFRAIKDLWNDAYDDRQVSEAQLYDTSIVTYPANPGTSAEIQEAMRSALGREGVGLMWSMRSALPALIERRELPGAAGDQVEQALKALTHADELTCRRFGMHGRARTFQVARTMIEVRQGKVLSSANESLLRSALQTLSAADDAHAQVGDAHASAANAITAALDSAAPKSGDGKDGNSGGDNGDPITPADGAGARKLPPAVIAARNEVLRLKQHR